MKKLFLIIPFLLITFVINGQDLIVCKNGNAIKCAVTDADSLKIFFNTNVDGYVIKRSIARSETKAVQFGNDSGIEPIRERQQAKEIQPSVEVRPAKAKEENTKEEYIKKETKTYLILGFTLPGFKGNTDAFIYSLNHEVGNGSDFKKGTRLFPINFGGGIDVNLSSSFTFRGGIEFVPKGVRYRNAFTANNDMVISIKVNYIELPLSVLFSPVEWKQGRTSYYLKGGFAPAYKVISVIRQKGSGSNGYNSGSESETSKFNGTSNFDICQFVGFGIEKGSSYAFEFKYEQGLRNVMDQGDLGLVFYNKSLSFSFILKI